MDIKTLKYGLFWVMFSLTGCVQTPIDFSVTNVPTAPGKIDCKLASITVTVATNDDPDGKNYGLHVNTLQSFVPVWQSALQDALNQSAVFNYDSKNYCSVSVKILGLKFLTLNPEYPITVYARYSIIDLKTGKPILSLVEFGHSSTSISYSLNEFSRFTESESNAGRNNISKFIKVLTTQSDLSNALQGKPQ